jgi:hypothetical protein
MKAESLSWGKSDRGVELTTHLYQAPRLKKVEVHFYPPSGPSCPVTERNAPQINLYVVHRSFRKILRSWLICSKWQVSNNNTAKMSVWTLYNLQPNRFPISTFLQDRQCTYKRHIEDRSRKRCCRGKAIRIIYCVCVCVWCVCVWCVCGVWVCVWACVWCVGVCVCVCVCVVCVCVWCVGV